MAKKKKNNNGTTLIFYFFCFPFIIAFYMLKSLYYLFIFLIEAIILLLDKRSNRKKAEANQQLLREAFYKIMKSDGNLDTVDAMSIHGQDFELFTVQLLLHNGFTDAYATKASCDYGIDVVAKKNGESYAIQCKCYSKPVGNKAVQEAYSGKSVYKCDHAVVFTNNYYTKAAKITARENNVILWDRTTLIDLMCNVDTDEFVINSKSTASQARNTADYVFRIFLIVLLIFLIPLTVFSVAVSKAEDKIIMAAIFGIPSLIFLLLLIRNIMICTPKKDKHIEHNESSNDNGNGSLLAQMLETIVKMQTTDPRILHRKLKIELSQAELLLDQLEQRRHIGPMIGDMPREIYVTRDQLPQILREINDTPYTSADQIASEPTQTVSAPHQPNSAIENIDGYAIRYHYEDVEVCVWNDSIPKDTEVGNRITFIQEKSNKYDNKAVLLLLVPQQRKLGYLYRGKLQDMVNDYIGRGDKVTARISNIVQPGNRVMIDMAFYLKVGKK